MTRRLEDARAWAASGGDLFASAVERCATDEQMAAGSQLAGWTRKHVVAHVAANADALRNLVHWARTGEETPMYTSTTQRNDDISTGAGRPAAELVTASREATERLAVDLATLPEEAWQREIRTAQGRTVPATEIPWMRAREVNIHAIDLGVGVGFSDLPEGFLLELVGEIAAKRDKDRSGPALELAGEGYTGSVAGSGRPTRVTGSLPQVAAYLTGRPHELDAPDLPAWL